MILPLVDLKREYEALRAEIDPEMEAVLESGRYILGERGMSFEKAFAGFCGVPHAISVGSGTAALVLALKALGVGAGDEVITAANSFVATAEAISVVGARPVLVDVDPQLYTLYPAAFEAAIVPRTRAVIPVHLYGHPSDMEAVARIARRHRLAVLEDACQAHGAEYQGIRVGSLGDAAAFSFYPAKNLGAYGDGGAMTTGRTELAEAVRLLRDHGQTQRYTHELVGYNSRLDELQAAILSVKLRHLDAWNARRRQMAHLYQEYLADLEAEGLAVLPTEAPWGRHVYHLYVIQVEKDARDPLVAHLQRHGVGVQVHYPIPIHLQPAYAHLGHGPGSLPVTEQVARRIVSLPMFPHITQSEVEHVCCLLREFLMETLHRAYAVERQKGNK